MFVVLLRFSDNKSAAGDFMDEHNQWLKKGFASGMFMFVGSITSGGGGVIFANGKDMSDIEAYVAQDPFVIKSVVIPEIVQLDPKKAIEPLNYLMELAS